MIPGLPQVEGRYVILYCDINPYTRVNGEPTKILDAPGAIQFLNFLVRYDEKFDPDK